MMLNGKNAIALLMGLFWSVGISLSAVAQVGLFEKVADWQPTGVEKLAGSVTYDDGVYTLQGSGSDIAGSADQGFYVYKEVSGDWSLQAKFRWVDAEQAYARCGLMIRGKGEDVSSANYFASIRNELITTWAGYRTADGGTTNWYQYLNDQGEAFASPQEGLWVRMTRQSATNLLVIELSPDGQAWTPVHTLTLTLPDPVTCGLAIESHTTDSLAVAEVSDVSLRTAPALVTRSFSVEDYVEGESFQVNLQLINSSEQTASVTVVDRPPSGWAVENISNGGTYSAGMVKWILDAAPGTTELTYTITPADAQADIVSWSGTVNDLLIFGDNYLVKATPVAGIFERAVDWITVSGELKPTGRIALENDVYLMEGSGSNIWGNQDEGFFVYKELSGSWSLEGKLVYIDYGQEPAARCGIMLRENPRVSGAINYFAAMRGSMETLST